MSQTQVKETTTITHLPQFLPQCGFKDVENISFDSLVKSNRFLFRVYTPKLRSPIESEGTSIFFLAPKFDGKFNHSASSIDELISSDFGNCFSTDSNRSGYEDAIGYLDWTKRPSSPYLSASFNFGWAIWEALRRYKEGIKHSVEIAVIDAASVATHSATLLQMLRSYKSDEQCHGDHKKWLRYAEESQSALIHGYIPSASVLSSIPFLSILSSLPHYFLYPQPSIGIVSTITDPNLVGWSNTSKGKLSYRQYCHSMNDRFAHLSFEERLRDATVGSVRLAMTFLRPWIVEGAIILEAEGLAAAVDTATDLACGVANWQWESSDSDAGSIQEMTSAIRSMVQVLVEELRMKRLGELVHLEEVSKLHQVADELENVVKTYERHISSHVCSPPHSPEMRPVAPVRERTDSMMSRATSFSGSDGLSPSMTAVHSLPSSPLQAMMKLKVSIPEHEPLDGLDELVELSGLFSPPYKTPATSFPSFGVHEREQEGEAALLPLEDPEASSSSCASSSSGSDSRPSTPSSVTSSEPQTEEAAPCLPVLPLNRDEMQKRNPSSQTLTATTSSYSHEEADTETSANTITDDDVDARLGLSNPFSYDHAEYASSSLEDDGLTISYLVSGFLFGAFIALCLMGPQKRVVVSHWTMT